MRFTFALCALLTGLWACGGRTVSDDYARDAGPGTDTPGADVPVTPDVPSPEDVPVGCTAPRVLCQGLCVDRGTDTRHCGACGIFCGRGQSCVAGRCMGGCPDGQLACGGRCVDASTDRAHCGACDRACPSASVCMLGTCRPVTMMGPFGGRTFRIETLTGQGCTTAPHAEITGDDRGGIAATLDTVLYTGDDRTAEFPVDALPMARPIMARYDGLVSDLATGIAYTLTTQGRPFDVTSVPDGARAVVLDGLIALGPGGVLGAARVPFSEPVRLSVLPGTVGIYAGAGRIVLHDDTVMHHIAMPSGQVTTVPFTSILPRTLCEAWATWGIAEYADDTLSLVYVASNTRIARYNTRTGVISTVAVFRELSDMCAITALPRRGLWAFHHEGQSQFAGGDETLGTCRGTFRLE